MQLDFLNYLDIDYNVNPYSITNATYIKEQRKLIISVNFDKVLSIKEFTSFKDAFAFHFKDDSILVEVKINYKNKKADETLLREYLDYIINELSTKKPRYKCFNDIIPSFEDNTFVYLVQYDSEGLGILTSNIEAGFKHFGLDTSVEISLDENSSIEKDIFELEQRQRESIRRMQQETKDIKNRNDELSKVKGQNVYANLAVTKIVNIPTTFNDLQMYSINKGLPNFIIEAYIFHIEIKEYPTSNLAIIKVTDDSDSIVIKKWLRGEEKEIFKKFTKDEILRIQGRAEFDSFSKNVVIMASKIELVGKVSANEILDNAVEKRIELHAHSKMSALDGIVDVDDYLKQAAKWGHKGIAITDHNGVYNIPDIDHNISNYDLKPIFGVELNYIDDTNYYIAFNNKDINLKETTFVVFDIETTGFSEERDAIIELAAIKCNYLGEIDSFETFVNPKMHIRNKITEITSINDETVKDAPTIDEVLPKFLEFAKGSILVAHNAIFDVSNIKAKMRMLNIEPIDFAVIDTLNAFRALHFNDVKRFNLKELAKFYKVKQEHHHRAIDDTRVTTACFISMLAEFFNKGILNYQDINSLINPNIFYKAYIPKHINVLVQNQVGLKNLYKMLSDAMTVHCYGEPRLLKSVLEEYREGLLVLSGCVNGEVFNEALNGNYENLVKMIDFYDYIEVQPPLAYKHLFDEFENGQEVIEDTIKIIIKAAKEKNKLVVATSDCHYLHKADSKYRDILINSPQLGGGKHKLAGYSQSPDMHFRTTDEMLDEFSFLGSELAKEIVVTNTNIVFDKIEKVQAFPKQMFAPRDDEFKDSLGVDSIEETTRKIVAENVKRLYGDNPHLIVTNRIKRELESIISNGYASVYYMSHLLVTKSLKDGYLVGSRGSVGSSLVATMMQITEINPLQPHYRCPKCKFQTFKMNEEERNNYKLTKEDIEFAPILQSVDSGYDLPDATCPICGEKLIKDGHDIPFETFLGFNGDKVPDIDLNFSGDYQSRAHSFVREFMGYEHAFRGGTISKLKEKNAYGYVKGYCERKGINLRSCEIDRLSQNLENVRRSTGQHPGGIIVVPGDVEIYDVTPIQYPADDIENEWRTTHFDYHSFENNLLKLDILGHDDPTMIKYLMDYVHEHQEDFPFDNPQDIPIDDKNVYRLFNSTDVLNLSPEDLDSPVASFGIPEFGTSFVRKLLLDTLPKTFSEIVKISGLSHGQGIWAGNAQDLVAGTASDFGVIPFSDVIGCRDDIMVYLLYQNLEPLKAFEIMEFVRKGKVGKNPEKWAQYKAYMIEKKVPDWYIWSCEQIKYMFPKAHATAYVLMAMRIAWFKVYAPKLFYSAWFSSRAKGFDVNAFVGGKIAINALINELSNKSNKTDKDDDLIISLQVAREMVLRGIRFLPVDIFKSDAQTFIIEEEGLRIPFVAIDGLGLAVALDIVEKRKEKAFSSKKDIQTRTKINNTIFEQLDLSGAFGNLPEKDPAEEFGLFGLKLE